MSRVVRIDGIPYRVNPSVAPDEAARVIERLRRLARLMDSEFRVPGTNFRVGLDPILGLLEGVGDTIAALISFYIVYEARRLGAPRRLLARMSLNVVADWLVGSIPLLGDLFDAGFKANLRNLKLLEDWWLRRA